VAIACHDARKSGTSPNQGRLLLASCAGYANWTFQTSKALPRWIGRRGVCDSIRIAKRTYPLACSRVCCTKNLITRMTMAIRWARLPDGRGLSPPNTATDNENRKRRRVEGETARTSEPFHPVVPQVTLINPGPNGWRSMTRTFGW
jgi:hypothetical protein